ncbi:MAG: 3-deoxy-manno-octulosonate cytidylyltransferase [Candidatus Omnitrophica bacterium]|nr:3-deoxy-manno-octulosonate cytidylyltransferase [Candidatus Omnitrophota bacterium]
MRAIGVIPARFESSRFPGKVLAELLGRPLIQYAYEEALKAGALEDLVVATDDERVLKAVENFGGRAVLTAKGHKSGTDRLTEVVNPIDTEIVVNIQADEPLIHFSMIDELVGCLSEDPGIPMASLIHKIEDEHDLKDPNVVKVVKDKDNFALYFSRSLIPYSGAAPAALQSPSFYKHLGLYAYTKDFLFTFTNLPEGELEKAERLEQLRALENGYKIKLIETRFNTIGVDTPQDLEKVRVKMSENKSRKSYPCGHK